MNNKWIRAAIPDASDSQILVVNAAVARKHKVGFDVIDNSW